MASRVGGSRFYFGLRISCTLWLSSIRSIHLYPCDKIELFYGSPLRFHYIHSGSSSSEFCFLVSLQNKLFAPDNRPCSPVRISCECLDRPLWAWWIMAWYFHTEPSSVAVPSASSCCFCNGAFSPSTHRLHFSEVVY